MNSPILPYSLRRDNDGTVAVVQNEARRRQIVRCNLRGIAFGAFWLALAIYWKSPWLIALNAGLILITWPLYCLILYIERESAHRCRELVIESDALFFHLPSGKPMRLWRDELAKLIIQPGKTGQNLVPVLCEGRLYDHADAFIDRCTMQISQGLLKHDLGFTLDLGEMDLAEFLRLLAQRFPGKVALLDRSPDGKYTRRMPAVIPPPLPVAA